MPAAHGCDGGDIGPAGTFLDQHQTDYFYHSVPLLGYGFFLMASA